MDEQAEENLEEALVYEAQREVAHEGTMAVWVTLLSADRSRDRLGHGVGLGVLVLVEGQLEVVFGQGDWS